MKNDLKRGELIVTIKGEIYPKGSIGMVTNLHSRVRDGKIIEDMVYILVLWFNHKFPGGRQTGWILPEWVKRFEKEDK